LTDAHYEIGFSKQDCLSFYKLVFWLRIMPGTNTQSKHTSDFRKTLEEITTDDQA